MVAIKVLSLLISSATLVVSQAAPSIAARAEGLIAQPEPVLLPRALSTSERLEPRKAKKDDIHTPLLRGTTELRAQVERMTKKVNKFEGRLWQKIDLWWADHFVKGDVKDATKHAEKTAPLTAAQAHAVLDEIDLLVVAIEQSLAALTKKEAAFNKANIKWFIRTTLDELRQRSDKFGMALAKKIPKEDIPRGAVQLLRIQKAFKAAIISYADI